MSISEQANVNEAAQSNEQLSTLPSAQQKALMEMVGVVDAVTFEFVHSNPTSRAEFEQLTQKYEAEAKQTELAQQRQAEIVRVAEEKKELAPVIAKKEIATLAVETVKTTSNPNAYKLAADALEQNGLDPEYRATLTYDEISSPFTFAFSS